MARGAAYVSAADFKTAYGITVSTFDVELALQVKAVSRYVDRIARREFNQDAAVVTRSYMTEPELASDWLEIDDVSTKTGFVLKVDEDRDGVTTDETAWTIDTDYQLEPLNAGEGEEAKPWTSIRIPPWTGKSLFPRAMLVTVTAKFGWAAVPDAIRQATMQLVGILRMDSPRATIRIQEDIGSAIQASSAAQRIVTDLIMPYKRRRFP